jgi:hypothetical protein
LDWSLMKNAGGHAFLCLLATLTGRKWQRGLLSRAPFDEHRLCKTDISMLEHVRE